MNIRPVNNINYKGVHLANIKVKGNDACYKLYEVNNKDFDFLNKMYNSVNVKTLMPNMKEIDYIIWDAILEHAIDMSRCTENHSLLETCNNKPCGFMTYKDVLKKYHINYIATFPTEKNKRIPCAGQILFNELFKRLSNSNKIGIDLSAIIDAPFNPISKYLKLGFCRQGGDEYCEYMGINKSEASKTLKEQSKFIISTPIKHKENIDLYNEIKLNVTI